MIDEREIVRRAAEALTPPEPSFDRLLLRRDRVQRNRRIRAGVLGIAVAIAVGWWGINEIRSAPPIPADRSEELSPSPHPEEPTPTPSVWSPVLERGASVVAGHTWPDPFDATVGWVDVKRVRFFTLGSNDALGQPTWTIELAAKPPLAADLQPGRLIAYGLVLDTNSDGGADYLIGIDNAAPDRGDFHVWVTNLATGETDEQIGPPYGLPIEFGHPDETRSSRTMSFTFLPGSAPPDLNPETVRFYAWASTSDGEVLASDYAPDTGWATRP